MKTYLLIINLVLLTAAAYLGVDIFYQLAGAKLAVFSPAVDATQKAIVTSEKPVEPLNSYQAIYRRNLFKLDLGPNPAPQPAKVAIESLKETDLNLKLWGTVTGTGAHAYAVIEDTKLRRQQLYHVADAVQNAIVKEIHREKVVLEVGDNLEVLQMEKIDNRQSVGRRAVRRATRRVDQASPSTASKKITLKRERIESAVNDLGSLMKQVRIRPHYKDGKSDGLTLSGIRSNSIFSEMGFRNGDVIVGVDDNDIESVDDALSLYENLQSAESVQVQIRRRGRLQTIDYQVE